MSENEMTQAEKDAAVIARRPQRYADLRAITELRSFSPEETVLLVRVANAGADLIKAQHCELDRLTAERDAARAEVNRLRAACSRKEDVYPTETVIIRSASDLLVEFSQFAFFLGDIRKSKEASYRAQYIRAALDIESEENE